MVYLLKIVIFHGYVKYRNHMVINVADDFEKCFRLPVIPRYGHVWQAQIWWYDNIVIGD